MIDEYLNNSRFGRESFFVPVPGVPGKDGSFLALETREHVQSIPATTWQFDTGLDYPVTSCNIVVDGHQVIAPWSEIIPGRIVIDFAFKSTGIVRYA